MVNLIDNRYMLQGRLGSGGMGTVYRVQDRLTQQIVALKQVNLYTSDAAAASDDLTRDVRLTFAVEFRMLASLRHPHIISVLDYGFDAQRHPYFTMELLTEAMPLTKAAADQPTDVKIRYLYQLLLALDYLHRRGVIHRDLKPDNVLVATDGAVKVLDFGLAQEVDPDADEEPDEIAGTMAYMAPELFSGFAASVKSDLYAFGLIAYEVLTGEFCFDRQNMAMLINAIMLTEPDTTMFDYDLGELMDTLLAKDPATRPSSALAVIQALGEATDQPVPEETKELRDSYLAASQFIGRAGELATLKNGLKAAKLGQGQGWLIGGESGVGKSRLLDELRIRALTSGVTVLRGQSVEGGALPYQLWREPVRNLLLSVEVDDLEAAVLKAVVPDISVLIGRPVNDAPVMSGAGAAERLSLTIVDLFKRQQEPMLLILEDLHWLQESLQPLQTVLRFYKDLPLMIVGSYRSDERPDLPEQLGGLQPMPLNRLSHDEVAQLTQSMLGEAGAQPHVVDLLTQETEGNAFFMVEVVRALAEEAGALHDIGRMSLPQRVLAGGMQAVVQRRLARLPEWVVPLLQQAAVTGRAIDRRLLKATDLDVDLDRWLRICADYAILEILDDNWRFAHDKLREQVLADLTDAQKVTLNRQIAEAIEATYPDDPAYLEALHQHWQAAGDDERALDYLMPLLENLVSRQAMLNRARELIMPVFETMPETDPRYMTLLKHLIVIHRDRNNYEDALIYAETMRDLATDPKMKATALQFMGSLHMRQRQLEQASDYAGQSLAITLEADDKPGQVDVYHLLGMISQYGGDLETAPTHYQQALSLARELDDDYRVMLSSNNLGILSTEIGDYDTARAYYEHTLATAKRIGARMGVAGSLLNIGVIERNQGKYDAAEARFTESLAAFENLQIPRGIILALAHLGNIADYHKDYETGLAHYQRSIDISSTGQDHHTHASTLNDMAFNRMLAGDLDAARTAWHESLTMAQSLDAKPLLLDILLGFAQLHRLDGDFEGSLQLATLIHQHPSTRKVTRRERFAELLADLGFNADDVILNIETATDDETLATIINELLA